MRKFVLVLLLLILISGCVNKDSDIEKTRHSDYNLTISSRSYFLGVVPTPKSVPESTFDDLTDAYKETGDIAEVTMIWTGKNIGQNEQLKKSRVVTAVRVYGLKPVLTLNFATIKEVEGAGLKYVIDSPTGVKADISDQGFRSLWIQEARELARDVKPEYFSLGNEVNDYFYLNPDDLEPYLTLLEEAYAAIKMESPDTKVMVVLSFTHLIDNNQWFLFEKFNDKVDIIGLTTYPWKHYDSPDDIPADYYSRITKYTNRPIAFTEIGWPSDNEKMQAEFLLRFVELTKDMNIEMVNWLFLHDAELTGIVGSVTDPKTGTIALKNSDGTKKEIYYLWLDLKELPIV
ncbi:MAG: glycosyl hydrolase 53 family protein [Candidatus Aenigmatarchaeota archaeon]|nr:MAG: glycosyl hydrolase 53 family protein [Candidatus Aenigmarchaeota archaeon]